MQLLRKLAGKLFIWVPVSSILIHLLWDYIPSRIAELASFSTSSLVNLFFPLVCRSRWLWSRFIPQSSYSPVKGLYLYGGVGTGKTMLMDLFFDQL